MENENQKPSGVDNPTTINPYPMYLLIVAGQTFSKEEKQQVLDRLNLGLINIGESLFNVKDELNNAIRSQSFESYNFDQEYRIVYNEKNLVVEILVNSTVKSFKRALRQVFLSNLSNKYFINATLDLNTNGDLNLQDAQFSYDDLIELLNDEQIKSNLQTNKDSRTTLYLNTRLVDLNKSWKFIEKSHKNIHLALNQVKLADAKFSYPEFMGEMSKFLNEKPLDQLMDSAKVIGTLRIQKPILYVFPGREGDSAFFTINGYSMLINGGYDRVKPCFWSFVSMLQQIDSVLITHTDADALGGLSSFFNKKLNDSDMKPTVLTVLGNLIGSKPQVDSNGVLNSPKPKNSTANAAQTAATLIASDIETNGVNKKYISYVDMILDSIDRLKIKLMPLVKSNDNLSKSISNSKYEHINLYYKLGQGSLDLYVLSPFANSADYKEFVQQQQNFIAKQTHHKSHLSVNQLARHIPLSHLNSAVVLLVWLPAYCKQSNADNQAVRLLFTGNAPQHVVLNALEKMKDFDVLSSAVYKAKSTEVTQQSNGTAKKSLHSNVNSVSEKPINTNATNGASKSNSNSNKLAVNVANTNGDAAAPVAKPHHNRVSMSSSAANGDKSKKEDANKDKEVKSESKPAQASASKPPKAVPQTNGSAKDHKNENKDKEHKENKSESSKDHKEPAKKAENSFSKKKSLNGPAAAKEVKEKEDDKESAEKQSEKSNDKVEKKSASSSAKTTNGASSVPSTGPKPSASSTAKKTDEQPSKPAAKPAAPKPSANAAASKAPAPAQSKEQPTKKPLSIEISSKKSIGNASASAPAKPIEKKDESRIITKRDAKPVAKSDVVVPSVPVVATPPVISEASVESSSQQVEPAVASSQLVDVEPVTNGKSDVNSSGEIVTEQVINIELISSNLENSNEVIKEPIENALNEQEPIANYNEWPNLSPVKKDQNGVGGNYLDENGNNSIDDTNESGVKPNGLDLQSANLVGEPADLIQSPVDENKNLFENDTKTDIMTRSFIDDGIQANPFEPKTTNGNGIQSVNRKNLDDSENDLNKTHELTDEETSELAKNDEIISQHIEGQNGTVDDNLVDVVEPNKPNPDQLIEGLQSLSIESKLAAAMNGGENGFKHHVQDEVKTESSTTWNLLELPKPVNPNDLPAAPLVNTTVQNNTVPTTSALNSDKKQTPNGKKAPPATSSLSPSNGASEEKTSVGSKQPAKQSITKQVQKPVNPVYVEVSYIPAHGNQFYVDAEFFKKVRARHYVLSTEEPNEHVLNSLIEAKETWDEKGLQVSLIPTYESEVMRRWFETNEETLARLKIDVMPAANYATVTMDDNPDLSCQVYKLEF